MRISSWISEHVAANKNDKTEYIEPFLGSGAVFEKVAHMFPVHRAGDAHPDLMLMWQALVEGWIPPDRISREEYFSLKQQANPSALRGFAGFGSSFGGKWFAGYVDRSFDVNNQKFTPSFSLTAKRAVLKTVQSMKHADLRICDYSEWTPNERSFVYCDPPYLGTTKYSEVKFETDKFLRTAEKWAEGGAFVLLSEGREYPRWRTLAKRTRKNFLRVNKGASQEARSELLLTPDV